MIFAKHGPQPVVSKDTEVQFDGFVLRWTWFCSYEKTINKIGPSLTALGYNIFTNLSARRSDVYDNCLTKNKKIWYSFSEGVTTNMSDGLHFVGLQFGRSFSEWCAGANNLITPRDLQQVGSRGLNYSLVIADSCWSGLPAARHKEAAIENRDAEMAPEVKQFADGFGPNVSYVGWAWISNANDIQDWSAEFIANLQGGRPIRQAYYKYRDNHARDWKAQCMLMYTKRPNDVIDLKARNR
jgi:hypothetical protein